MQETRRYSPDPDLSPVQHHVLCLLAQGVSITEAAAVAGVHRKNAGAWRTRPKTCNILHNPAQGSPSAEPSRCQQGVVSLVQRLT